MIVLYHSNFESMKAKVFLSLLFLFLIVFGCISKKYVYIQNKTDHDIHVYRTNIYDIEQDSLIRMIMQKNNHYNNYKEGKLTMHYYKVLKPDSLVFLDVVYGEKSKTELVDTNSNYFNSSLVIVLNADTMLFIQKEIIQKINETWAKKNSNFSVKLKNQDKTRLIWEFR